MEKYHGWIIKQFRYKEYDCVFLLWTFERTRKEVIETFEKIWEGEKWEKYRRKGFHKIVKVKLVEVE